MDKLTDQEQAFIDHILSTPYKDVNLLQVWIEFNKEKDQQNELLQVHTD